MQLSASLIKAERFDEALEVADLADEYQLDGLWSSYLRSRYAFMRGDNEVALRFAEVGLSTHDDEGQVETMRAHLTTIAESIRKGERVARIELA